MPKYIKAEEGPKRTVIYTDTDGKLWEFSGGSRPWRNTNPGNLVVGKVSKRNGAIGKAGGFAVFSSYDIGHAALIDSLKNIHGKKNIESLMYVYAPKKDNNTKKYIAFIRKKTGVKDRKKINDFSNEEFEKLWKAIEQMEGWSSNNTGEIKELSKKGKVIEVEKNKKGVIEFLFIDIFGWISKEKAVKLAIQNKIDAVVVYPSSGKPFLRSRPNNVENDNLGNLT